MHMFTLHTVQCQSHRHIIATIMFQVSKYNNALKTILSSEAYH